MLKMLFRGLSGSELGGLSMRHHWKKKVTLALAILLPMAACEDDGVTGPEDGMATLSIYLTDAPGDVAKVWVELIGLTAQGGEGGPVELLEEPTDLVLLTDLVGTVELLQVNTGLDATTISQLRLVVGDAVLEDKDGVVYAKGDPDLLALGFSEEPDGELHCPSCSQSGIKVKVPNDEMEVEEGAAAMVLDFDVAQSFGHKAGNSGKWIMHPVIKGTLVGDADGDGDVLDDLGLANSISGTVALADGIAFPVCTAAGTRTITDFIPTATSTELVDGLGEPMVWTGTVAEDGTYLIDFLPQGTYDMGHVETITLGDEQLTFQADPSQGQVTMTGEDMTGVDYTITASSCQ